MSTARAIRRAIGGVHVAAGLFLLVALVYQIVDLSLHDAIVPHQYFTYFTIDSTILNVGLLVLTGVSALRAPRDGVLLTSAALAIVSYALVTGVIYNTTLRWIPSDTYEGDPWPNEVMHVVIPAFLVLDWFVLRLFDVGRPRLPWRAIGIAVVFPTVWIVFTMLRGAVVGWYPYPFLEPDGPDGIPGIVGYIAAVTVAIVVVTAFGVLVSRAPGPFRSGESLTSGSSDTT